MAAFPRFDPYAVLAERGQDGDTLAILATLAGVTGRLENPPKARVIPIPALLRSILRGRVGLLKLLKLASLFRGESPLRSLGMMAQFLASGPSALHGSIRTGRRKASPHHCGVL